MQFSYFPKLRSRKPKQNIDIERLIDCIRSPSTAVADTVHLIRSASSPEEVKNLKMQLPSVTISGTFASRDEKFLVEHSGYYVYDIDHLGADELEGAKDVVGDLPPLVCAFVSPSGTGIKIVLAGPVANRATHFKHWSIGKHLVEGCGLPVDKSGSDVCRLCFLSDDPDLIEGFGESDPFKGVGVESEDDDDDDDDMVALFSGMDGGSNGGDEGVSAKGERDFSAYTFRVVREMLWVIGSDIPYRDWRNVIWGVVDHLGKKASVKDMLLEWSTELGGKRALPEDDVSAFMAIYKSNKSGVTLATTIKLARDKGWSNWRAKIRRDDDQKIIKDDANLKIILEEHPEFKGRLWNDQTTYDKHMEPLGNALTAVNSKEGGLVDENLGFEVLCDIQAGLGYGFRGVKSTLVAMAAIANRNTRNLRREWLEGLQWDGKRRLHKMFVDGFGVEDLPHNRAMTVAWLCGAVARMVVPGCSVQVVPILQGAQGTGKSSGIRALCPDAKWFCDSFVEMDSKAGYEVVLSSAIVELAELSSLRRNELDRVKQFVTQQSVRYREPYARAASDRPATWVFIGTTNEEEFLKDTTGNRRWAVMKVRDMDGLREDLGVEDEAAMVGRTVKWVEARRDQLWAEAYAIVKGGLDKGVEAWHLGVEHWGAFEAAAEAVMETDPWEELIEQHVLGLKSGVGWRLQELADTCGVRVGGTFDQMRFGKALRKMGLDRRHTRDGKRWFLDF